MRYSAWRKGFRSWMLALCGLWCVWPAGLARGAAAESAADRFLKEAPARWLEYRKIVTSHTECRAEGTCRTDLSSQALYSTFKVTSLLWLDGGCGLFKVDGGTTEGKPDPILPAEAFNPSYHFQLRRSAGQESWRLDQVVGESTRIPEDLIGRHPRLPLLMGEDSIYGSGIGGVCVGQMFWMAWLPHLVSADEFKLIRASYLPGQEELVKVEFQFETTKPTGGSAGIRSGFIVLDPKRYWLIRESKTKMAHPKGVGSLKITNQFSEFSDGDRKIPYVSHRVMRVSVPKSDKTPAIEHEWTSNCVLRAVNDFKKEQFTLSAFGLPEPNSGPLSRMPRLWVWVGAAMLVGCVVWLARRRWRNRSDAVC